MNVSEKQPMWFIIFSFACSVYLWQTHCVKEKRHVTFTQSKCKFTNLKMAHVSTTIHFHLLCPTELVHLWYTSKITSLFLNTSRLLCLHNALKSRSIAIRDGTSMFFVAKYVVFLWLSIQRFLNGIIYLTSRKRILLWTLSQVSRFCTVFLNIVRAFVNTACYKILQGQHLL